METGDLMARKRFLKSVLAASAGFFDIGLACALIADMSWSHSLFWGAVGAAVSTILYLVISFALAASHRSEPPVGDDFVARMEQLERDSAARPEDEDAEPLLVRWFWTAVLGLMAATFAVVVYLVSFSKSVVTVLVFAAVASGASGGAVVLTVALTIAIQVVISLAVVEPKASRWGVEL